MGEDAPQEASADDLLLLALRDGEQNIRQLSATVMGQLGMLSTFDDLYAMLSAPEAPLRDAAHRALSDLQMQTGYPLPAPS
jgi:HEAT repeat protein